MRPRGRLDSRAAPARGRDRVRYGSGTTEDVDLVRPSPPSSHARVRPMRSDPADATEMDAPPASIDRTMGGGSEVTPSSVRPSIPAALRASAVDFFYNSWRLVPANLVWGAAFVAVGLLWLSAPLLGLVLVPLLALPT